MRPMHPQIALFNVEMMNAIKRYFFEQEFLDIFAVVYVHELAWNKPCSHTAFLHPCLRQNKEIRIKPTETV